MSAQRFEKSTVSNYNSSVSKDRLPLANRSALLPFIEYKNHKQHMTKVKAATDTGRKSPEKASMLQTKKIRHELSTILNKKKR